MNFKIKDAASTSKSDYINTTINKSIYKREKNTNVLL